MESRELRVVYPHLAQYLATIEAECAYDSVVQALQLDIRQIASLNCEEVQVLLKSLPISSGVAQAFHREVCDGLFLVSLDQKKWHELNVGTHRDFALLNIIVYRPTQLLSDSFLSRDNALVKEGLVADLSSLSTELVETLVRADEEALEFGVGLVYGTLTVLGPKEYAKTRHQWQGVGLPNEQIVLSRRKVPNGIVPVLTNNKAFSDESLSISLTSNPPPAPAPAPASSILTDFASYGMMTCPDSPSDGQGQSLSPAPLGSPESGFETPKHSSSPILSLPLAPSAPKARASQTQIIRCVPDPSLDMFSIGRIAAGNDLVVPGALHEPHRKHRRHEGPAKAGMTSTVGRQACRVVCERVGPHFRSFLFSGGFGSSNELSVWGQASALPLRTPVPPIGLAALSSSPSSSSSSSSSSETETETGQLPRVDGLTRSGVRLWQPSNQTWVEISVLGQACNCQRQSKRRAGALMDPAKYNNELQDGSVIDVGGICLLFKRPVGLSGRSRPRSADQVISAINRLQPTCPVMFHPIEFSFISKRERALNHFRRLEREGSAYTKRRPFAIPASDDSHISAERRTMVFPACGHVHGFHEPLQGRPCPLCRKHGPYTAVAFAFEPALCHRIPTHVFNPCGHVASRATCDYWASIPLPDPTGANGLGHGPRCPFCAVALCRAAQGGPFNRLIFQGEAEWGSDDSDCDSESDREVAAIFSATAENEDDQETGMEADAERASDNERKAFLHFPAGLIASLPRRFPKLLPTGMTSLRL